LVHQVASQNDLEASLDAISAQLKSSGKTALRETKKLLRDVVSAPYEAGREMGIGLIASLRVGTEGQEGLRSFLEKRSPSWRAT
jgi:methylglutaconyl-CoA hydratase